MNKAFKKYGKRPYWDTPYFLARFNLWLDPYAKGVVRVCPDEGHLQASEKKIRLSTIEIRRSGESNL